jgi:hypothetical protein
LSCFGPYRDRGAVAQCPAAYICIVLSGEGEVATSDGKTLRLRAGELIYCDDVSGTGHVTRSISDVRLAFINRAKAWASGARTDLFLAKEDP